MVRSLVQVPFGRILIPLGAVLFLLVGTVVALAIRDARSVATALAEITRRHRPLAETAYEIEINLYEFSAATLTHVASQHDSDIANIEAQRRDLLEALAAYERLVTLSKDPTSHLLAQRLRDLTRDYLAAADTLLVTARRNGPRFTRESPTALALTRFHTLQRSLDTLLDDELQPNALSVWHGEAARARQESRRTAILTSILAPLALILGFFAVQLPVKAYARTREAQRETERLSQAKTELASITAHELRSPLTAILGSVRLLAAGRAGPMPEGAIPYLDMASRNVARLLDLINELLDLDRIEAGMLRFVMKPVHAGELVRLSSDGLAAMASDLGVVIESDCRTQRTVVGDAARLQQVMTNLLSNALKHAPNDSRVSVTADDRAANVRFTIRDRGPGIAPADRERIFQRFVQTNSASRHPGTGLGLTIAREIVLRHSGEIGVDSQLGAGAAFWFEIPASA